MTDADRFECYEYMKDWTGVELDSQKTIEELVEGVHGVYIKTHLLSKLL